MAINNLNKNIKISILILVIIISGVIIVFQLGVKKPVLVSEGSLNMEVISNENVKASESFKEDIVSDESRVMVEETQELKKHFPINDQAYLFSVRVLNQLEGVTPPTYNINLTAKFSPDTDLDIPLVVESNVGPLNIRESYRLFIEYDANSNKYIVTEINASTIYD